MNLTTADSCAQSSYTSDRKVWGWWLLPLILLLQGVLPGRLAAAAEEDAVYQAMAPALSRLNPLAQQFDTNHDQSLAPAEQAGLVAYVAQKYGSGWAERLRRFLRAADGNQDGTIDLTEWQRAVRRVGAAAKQPAPAARRETRRLPMRDGTALATDIYLPPGPGPFPVVLSRTPYGRGKLKGEAAAFTGGGYGFVAQDMRGRFESAGDNRPFIGCGWGEFQDGVDTLVWITNQPWCNGRVGTTGVSAGGITQNLLAGAAPAGLTAQYITVAAASLYGDGAYVGGAFRLADMRNWLTGNQFDPQALAQLQAQPQYNDFWRGFDTTTWFARMTVPAVHLGGWFDMFCQGTIDEFVGRQHRGGPGSRGTQKLVMGPWTHATGKMPAGQLIFPHAEQVPTAYRSARWFEHYLAGAENGVEREPAVIYYVMGDTLTPGAPGNEWRQAGDWPVPARETPLYFTADGELRWEAPTAPPTAHRTLRFDPANPCPTIGGNNLTLARGPMNQQSIEARPDVLGFTSAPLRQPVEVTGRVRATVYVASSAVDTDVSVRLGDVYPDGQSYQICEGILRLRDRHSFASPERLTPGQVEAVTVDCWSTSMIFNRGHRLRVNVTASNYPRFDLNPGTGLPWSEGGKHGVQTNSIYASARYPSEITLPVVGAAGGE